LTVKPSPPKLHKQGCSLLQYWPSLHGGFEKDGLKKMKLKFPKHDIPKHDVLEAQEIQIDLECHI
jgi:hypothetical protein